MSIKNKRLVLVLLFIFQIVVSIAGSKYIFPQKTNPVVLLLITVVMTFLALNIAIYRPKNVGQNGADKQTSVWWYVAAALLPFLLAYEELRKAWVHAYIPEKYSDVIPQLKAQCQWFFKGEFPYQEVDLQTYKAYPVYMPLHWGTLQLGFLLGIDVRWAGVIFLFVAVAIVSYFIGKYKINSFSGKYAPLFLILLSLPMWGFLAWNRFEIGISYEFAVTAWYVVLAGGLMSRNLWLIGIGISGMLLSRYTGVFWLPGFAVILWAMRPAKQSIWLWAGVVASVVLLFVLPFWAKDTTLMSKALLYHNNCALNGWAKPDKYTFIAGVNLAEHLRVLLPGTPEHSLYLVRLLGGIVMAILSFGGAFYYIKYLKDKINFFQFSLIHLQLILWMFYLLSPMTFQYYLLGSLTTTAFMVADVCD